MWWKYFSSTFPKLSFSSASSLPALFLEAALSSFSEAMSGGKGCEGDLQWVHSSFCFTLFLCSLIVLHGLQSLWEYLLSCDLLPPTFVFPPFQTLFLPPLSLWHFLSFLNYNFTKVPLAWLMTSAVSYGGSAAEPAGTICVQHGAGPAIFS